jgi:Gp157 protein
MSTDHGLLLTEEDVGLPPAKPNLNPFQLAAELQQLLDFQEEAETEEEQKAATAALAEYVKGAVTLVDPIIGYLGHGAMMATAARSEAHRLTGIARVWDERVRRVKEAARLTMELLGLKKITGKTGTLMRKGNGGKLPVIISNPELIPDELINVTVTMPLDRWKLIQEATGEMLALPDNLNPEPSLTRIGEALATGNGVPGASFGERGEHLEVK